MIRLGAIVVTGVLAFALTACGEHGNSKPVAADTNAQQQQQQQGAAPQQQPASNPAH